MFPTKLIDLQMSPSKNENYDLELVMSAQPQWSKDSFLPRQFNSEPDKKLRQQLLDEVNKEADLIIRECNLLLEEPVTDFSHSRDASAQPNPSLPNIFEEIGMSFSTSIYFLLLALDSTLLPTQVYQKCQGRLKFFDEAKNYGFIIMDRDGSDIFVYSDDLAKTGLAKEFLKTAKYGNLIRFSFTAMEYFGKYQKSRKAIDLEYIKPTQQQNNPFMMIIPAIRF